MVGTWTIRHLTARAEQLVGLVELGGDHARQAEIGRRSRSIAEEKFDLDDIAARFRRRARGHPDKRPSVMNGHRPRCALITGVGGQDGVYLARLLGDDGVRVVGTVRPGTSSSPRCRAYLGHVELVEHDVRDSRGWEPQLDRYQPDEIYNLAAMSSRGTQAGRSLTWPRR